MDFPNKTSIYNGFSIAMLNYQRVTRDTVFMVAKCSAVGDLVTMNDPSIGILPKILQTDGGCLR